jgi:hypothetical protein
MDLIGIHGATTFSHRGWTLLIELAREYGWKPAGAVEPAEEGETEAAVQALELTKEELEPYRVPADHPLAQAVRSLSFRSGDPVLDSYFNNAGFRVTAEDARGLADALERALTDIPRHEALEDKAVTMAGAPGERFLPIGTPVNPFEWFSGENRAHLQTFIGLCRKGGFEIR